MRCLFHPRVIAVTRKRPRSFYQKCSWQVTPKHVCTLAQWVQPVLFLQETKEVLRKHSWQRMKTTEKQVLLAAHISELERFLTVCSEITLWVSQPWKGKSTSTTPISTGHAVSFTVLSTSPCPDTWSSGCPTFTSLSRHAMTLRWKFVTSQNVTICYTGHVGGNLRPEYWVLQMAWSLTSQHAVWWRQHCQSSFQQNFLVLHPAFSWHLPLVWKVTKLWMKGRINEWRG